MQDKKKDRKGHSHFVGTTIVAPISNYHNSRYTRVTEFLGDLEFILWELQGGNGLRNVSTSSPFFTSAFPIASAGTA